MALFVCKGLIFLKSQDWSMFFSNSRRQNDTYDLSFMVLLPKQPGTELENKKGFL